jgi:formylglycine-generating enzyme required for sulfatase activity
VPASRHRELKSDFLLVKVGPADWLPFRDVFEVDGQAIRDRQDRLAKIFLQPTATALEQAKQIAVESARYNIGAMQRTINTPTLALVFLQLDTQARLRFTVGKRDAGVGANVWIVEYREESRPTLVRGIRDSDIPASGRFWIDAETGRVPKTELNLETAGVRARVTTSFRRDERFQIDVPFEMNEQYSLDRGQVSGTATYGRFRRFDVNSDETFHTPAARTVSDRRSGMTFVEVQPGRFTMGSPMSEIGRGADEVPHDVTINRPFFLGQHEVTQEEWRAVMGTSPSHFSGCGPRCPVESVTFGAIERFLAALNAQPDRELAYRLPTEAEWEYACRAGTLTPFSTGDTLMTTQANFDGRRPYGASPAGVMRDRPTRAGGFASNAWGLTDMHGNVWEWTSDFYGPYPPGDAVDPVGATTGETRVVRGGSWQADAASARCAARAARNPGVGESTIGFRVAADSLPK